MAETALRSAQEVEAQKFNKTYYIKANSYFLKAEMAFQRREYEEAKKLFRQSQLYAEKAELFNYLKRNINTEEVLY